MKLFRRGFTLAEVMVAMAIVGISAALTMPLVANNAQKHQAGVVLGRAVTLIEEGCQNMIQLANQYKANGSSTDVLSGVSESDIGFSVNPVSILSGGNLNQILPLFCNMDNTPLPAADLLNIRAFNNTNNIVDNARVTGATRYAFKNLPAEIAIFQVIGVFIFNEPENPIGYIIYIDTNGWSNGPNCTGKDVFAFELLNGGTLRPATGTEAGDYARDVVKDKFKITYY